MARILLVDDDIAARELLARTLVGDGHAVTTADNGADAMARLSEGFDLVVTDIQMPEVDGVQLAERVQAAEPSTKIILMSGLTGGLDKAAGLKSRLAGTLTKPVTPDDLRTAVRAALG
jgi:CheY-like chemotaxis protein